MMNAQPVHAGSAARDPGLLQALSPRAPLVLSDVVLHHLRTPADIAGIIDLRDEIDLSVHAASGRAFELLEKKETSAVSCSDSSSRANGSARSASSRWGVT